MGGPNPRQRWRFRARSIRALSPRRRLARRRASRRCPTAGTTARSSRAKAGNASIAPFTSMRLPFLAYPVPRSLCAGIRPGLGSPLSHLLRNRADPSHTCTRTGFTPAISAPGLGSPLPLLLRDWAHPSHICIATGLTPATSAPGMGSPLPHLSPAPLPQVHRAVPARHTRRANRRRPLPHGGATSIRVLRRCGRRMGPELDRLP